MFPAAIDSLLEFLPSPEQIRRVLPEVSALKARLEELAQLDQTLPSHEQATHLRTLDQALALWRHKRLSSAEFNKLSGLFEVARALLAAVTQMSTELQRRQVAEPSTLIDLLRSKLLGEGSILEIPQRQLELMYQVLESVVSRTLVDKLTPPIEKSITDDLLATMSDEALLELPAEDSVLSATRRLMQAIVRFANSFNLPTVDLSLSVLEPLASELKQLVDLFVQIENTTYDVCELANNYRLLNVDQLQEANREFVRHLFPTEIIVMEPVEGMQEAWRDATLERQIKADMEDTLRECLRSDPVANALMAEFAQTKDLKIYEEARWMVLPEARKSLEDRIATEILNKATDEFENRDTIHRYPVAITSDLRLRVESGELRSAERLADSMAVNLMKRFLPDVYQQHSEF